MVALSQMISIAVQRYAGESEQTSTTCGNPEGAIAWTGVVHVFSVGPKLLVKYKIK